MGSWGLGHNLLPIKINNREGFILVTVWVESKNKTWTFCGASLLQLKFRRNVYNAFDG